MRFEDAGSWTNNVQAVELLEGYREGIRQLCPICNVSLAEDCSRCRRISVDELLSFRPQRQIRNNYITTAREQEGSEFIVDALQ